MTRRPKNRALSQLDSFFVAYQECSGILMQSGVEVKLKGRLQRGDLERMLLHLVSRWPQLGQTLSRRLFGLSWSGRCRVDEMLHSARHQNSLALWRNRPLDPFREPPFQLLWISENGMSRLAFRAHHAVVDGESFFRVCGEALRTLARMDNKGQPVSTGLPESAKLTDLVSLLRLLGRGKLGGLLRHAAWLRAESRAGRSARLTMSACQPGDIATCEWTLDREAFHQLKHQAEAIGVAPAWLCAAAWMRAIYAWNVSHDESLNSIVSLEVPVSLRRGRKHDHHLVGNFISPLVLFGDARLTLEELARKLKKQLMTGIRKQTYLAMPLLTAPARFLPWVVFRRLAVNPATTGFATSHFTWFAQEQGIHAEISNLSRGALQILAQDIYTPVCLQMGAALAVVAWPESAQLCLTYRVTAFSRANAKMLLDFVASELNQDYQGRQQVAV